MKRLAVALLSLTILAEPFPAGAQLAGKVYRIAIMTSPAAQSPSSAAHNKVLACADEVIE